MGKWMIVGCRINRVATLVFRSIFFCINGLTFFDFKKFGDLNRLGG